MRKIKKVVPIKVEANMNIIFVVPIEKNQITYAQNILLKWRTWKKQF